MKEGGGSEKGMSRGSVHWEPIMLQPWTLRLTRNAAALAAASPTLLFQQSIQYSVSRGSSGKKLRKLWDTSFGVPCPLWGRYK